MIQKWYKTEQDEYIEEKEKKRPPIKRRKLDFHQINDVTNSI